MVSWMERASGCGDCVVSERSYGKNDRVSLWSTSEESALWFHWTFYGLSVFGIALVSYRFGSQTWICGWNWYNFRDFVTSISAVAISSAIITLIIIDGGGMLRDIYRDRKERKLRKVREDTKRELLHEIVHADVVLPRDLQDKYKDYLNPSPKQRR